jgi:hypothetical protein
MEMQQLHRSLHRPLLQRSPAQLLQPLAGCSTATTQQSHHSALTHSLPRSLLASSSTQPPQWPKVLNAPLSQVDPDLFDIIEKEKNRQFKVDACVD